MAEHSKIEWTDHTFNPWIGCTKVSPACDHCYAESWAKRTGAAHLWQGERRRTTEANWQKPLKWNRQAEAEGRRYRVFCASLADVFDNQVPEKWRNDLWHRIAQTPHLDWLLLTKRPQNIAKMLPDPQAGVRPWGSGWPHVWLGTTAENQEEADRRIPVLLATPAAVRFVSVEPLLEPLDLHRPWLGPLGQWLTEVCCRFDVREDAPPCDGPGCMGTRLDWVIVGGESGPYTRDMDPDWARSIRDQCRAAGVAFFMKQFGTVWAKAHSADSHGVDMMHWPEDLRIREFPAPPTEPKS